MGGGLSHKQQQRHWDFFYFIFGEGGSMWRREGERLIHILFQQHLSMPTSSNIFQANAERGRNERKRRAERDDKTLGEGVCLSVRRECDVRVCVYIAYTVCVSVEEQMEIRGCEKLWAQERGWERGEMTKKRGC